MSGFGRSPGCSLRRSRALDTDIVAAFKLFDPAELPVESAITAVTLGELSRGPYATDDPVKRAGRIAVLQYVEAAFGDPLPYDADAARMFGAALCRRVCAGPAATKSDRRPDDRRDSRQ